MARYPGINVRHRTGCGSEAGGKCTCRPAYQASAWSARDQKRLKKWFSPLAAAGAWRAGGQIEIRRGTMRTPTATIREAAEDLLEGMQTGRVRTRSGDPYKPS